MKHNLFRHSAGLWLAFVALLALVLPQSGHSQAPAPAKAAAKSAIGATAKPALNRILVFSRTKGYRHSSIPAGKRALILMGAENGFAVDTTEDAGKFTETNLKQYGAVVWLSTTGDVLDNAQQAAFERYIQAGGGYVGIHAATDTEYGWPWYNKLVGGQFASHPGNPNVQEGEAVAINKDHASMFGFPDRWKIKDEFYDFKNFNKAVNVLVKIDEKTYKDGKMGDDHPMAWYHDYDGGKAFYTSFGHPDETFTSPVFVKHLLGGLKSVMATELKFGQVRTQPYPEENRFKKTILTEKLDEPTELAVLDNGKVLFAQRKGELKLYDPKKKSVKIVANVPVYSKFEYGLMGLNIDPDFKTNRRIYLYYSPPSGSADTAQHLSRFVYDDVRDTLLLSTEELLLTVPVKRTDCCHTGGSIAWDKKGNLYLSTGDDTNPFNSNGYGPIDERAGRKGWDGQASSANTNDLRGKILRIKPRADKGYDIPADNLFKPDTEKARPEIYVMGNRNPYRIAVDQRTGFLYWGEVGPDAGENNEKYGPRGHDEVNQARQAGFFGWPLFVADNRAYREFNFADSTSSAAFDPAHPINNSPNNTGLTDLPPAQKAFIYYPYADSPEFGPIVGKGGRNAMGGPVYYYDDYPETAVKFPRHYDGKFFAYDWMRNWINPVTMNAAGDFVSMESFMPDTKFSHPIDMQFDKDGSLYVLEYGNNWFAQNDDAVLAHVTYNAGNRAPVAVASASKTVGAAPLTVKFATKGSLDYDGDALTYGWNFGKGLPKSTAANPSMTFTKPGVYRPVLTVRDAAGNVTTKTLEIKVGNDAPKVDVVVKGNRSFYFDNKPVDYEVKVTDKEDGTLDGGKISAEDVAVTVDYLEGFDKTMLAQGHQANTGFSTGKRLIELSDCKACHGINQKSIGPAYLDVAKKYKGKFQIEGKLADKIIKGGGGVWGEQAMSAHPQISKDDAKDMVRYILSLADDKAGNRQPAKGQYVTVAKPKDGSYIIAASYTDKGNGDIGPITSSGSVALRSATLKAANNDGQNKIMKRKTPTGTEIAEGLADKSYVQFNDLDLTGIGGVSTRLISLDERTAGGKLEIRADSPTGPLLGEADVKSGGGANSAKIPFRQPMSGMHTIYLVFVNPEAKGKPLFSLDTVQVEAGGM